MSDEEGEKIPDEEIFPGEMETRADEDESALPWTGCGMPPPETERPVPTVERVVEQRIYLRCPKCLGHLKEVGDVGKGQEGFFYDCPRCNLRLKMWEYFPGRLR